MRKDWAGGKISGDIFKTQEKEIFLKVSTRARVVSVKRQSKTIHRGRIYRAQVFIRYGF